jgi:response regulator RpfG family c-di-GMP phosphodiesterase
MMPHLNGIETCLRIRRMETLDHCPILFLSAQDSPESILQCLRAGGDDYLVKSTPLAELLARVQHLARKRPLEERLQQRRKGIEALEAFASASGGGGFAPAMEIPGQVSALEQLADFLRIDNDAFGDAAQILQRFGYLVGLTEAYAPKVAGRREDLQRFLRDLVSRTAFLDDQGLNALLENHSQIVDEDGFQEGWTRGRNDAPNVGLQSQVVVAGVLKKQPAIL